MKEKIIAAALTEMKIHSLRFTLIKSIIECKTMHFAECAEKILSGEDDTDTKIKKFCNCKPTPSGRWATTSGAINIAARRSGFLLRQ